VPEKASCSNDECQREHWSEPTDFSLPSTITIKMPDLWTFDVNVERSASHHFSHHHHATASSRENHKPKRKKRDFHIKQLEELGLRKMSQKLHLKNKF
jgi:hypothetical protein